MRGLSATSGVIEPVHISPAPPEASVLVVCEHASNHIPDIYGGLGLSEELQASHIAWDPGALPVAEKIARQLAAPLVAGTVSRLVYDCNRPPEAASAVPAQSEIYRVPGNENLTPAARHERVASVYEPFQVALKQEITRRGAALNLMVTIHSFNPTYRGHHREVEIGLLHGVDAVFANKMLQLTPPDCPYVVRLNEPYSAADGVAHTLDVQGAANGLLSVMIEVRNDLLTSAAEQTLIARLLGNWVAATQAALVREGTR